ncbi:MAG: hypothetical protein LBC68_13020 [Prevotellaceae bacterium]|nr:hypothetical protein [Prevotellaceae bacterium]
MANKKTTIKKAALLQGTQWRSKRNKVRLDAYTKQKNCYTINNSFFGLLPALRSLRCCLYSEV